MWINISDSIYRDPRFFELSEKLGSRFAALGALAVAWDLAQRFYLKSEDKNIPKHEWDKYCLPDLIIEVGLAHVLGDSVRVAGRDSYCHHLVKKQKAGKISSLGVLKNAKSTGVNTSYHTLTGVNVRQETPTNVNDRQRMSTSYSYSYSKKNKNMSGPSDTDQLILEIWEKRPKRGKNQTDPKYKALETMRNLSGEELAKIRVAVGKYKKAMDSIGHTGTEFVPMFITWLNQKRYLDYLESDDTPQTPKTIDSNSYGIKVSRKDEDENDISPEMLLRAQRMVDNVEKSG